MRIGRGYPQQSFTVAGQALGPRRPTVFAPVVTTLSVNLAVGLATNQRRAEMRFPLPGWGASGTQAADSSGQAATAGSNGGRPPALNVNQTFKDPAVQAASSFVSPVSLLAATVTLDGLSTGTPADTFLCELRADAGGRPGSDVLASAVIPFTGAASFVTAALVYPLGAGVTYWLVFRRSGVLDNTNFWNLRRTNSFLSQSVPFISNNSGASWGSSGGAPYDYFVISGTVLPGVAPGFRRNLGPFPPLVIGSRATEQQQTVAVTNVAVRSRRLTDTQRYPLPGWEEATTYQAILAGGPAPNTTDSFGTTTTERFGQSFVPATDVNITTISVPLSKAGAPTDNAIISIQADLSGSPSGTALASVTIPAASIGTTLTEFVLPLSVSLSGSQTYWLVWERSGALDDTNRPRSHEAGGSNRVPSMLRKQFAAGVWATFTGGARQSFGLYTDSVYPVFARRLGPQPPLLLQTVPITGKQAVIAVTSVAVGSRRLTDSRRFPLQGWEGATSFLTGGSDGPEMAARNLGPRPPLVVDPSTPSASPVVVTLAVVSTAVVQRAQLQRHEPKSLLFPPATLALPPPAPPVAITLQENRIRGFGRHFFPGSILSRPAVIEPPLQAPDRRLEIATTLVRARPRLTVHVVGAPAGLQVFSGAKTSFVQTRPRPTHPRFAGPVVVFAPPLAPPIDVVFARRVPPRRTKSSLPLVVFATAAFVAPPINVSLQENRLRGFGRRHFPASVLAPPTTLQAFAGPTVRLVSIRPRKTGWLLRPPTVVRTPSVEQAEQTIRTLLARIRPRPTSANLVPATTLQVFAGPAVTVARLRPRKTAGLLFEPTVLRIPSVEQREDTIFAALVRVRPRPTVRQLGQPTVLRVFAVAKVTLTEARPRPTAAALTPPTVVRVPAVEQLEQTVRVTLTHTRPRPTLRRLRPPTVLRVPSVEQQEQTIRARLVQTRPRPTSKHLSPPTVVVTNPPVVTSIRVALVSLRPPSERPRHVVEHLLRPPTVVIPLPSLRAQTITVKLARIRPVRTHASLTAVSYRAVSDLQASLVRTRPRRTISLLGGPTVLQTFAGPSTHTVEIRPRPTAAALTAARFPATSEISVALTRVRPRPTRTLLRPAATLQVFPGPVEHEITVSTVLERRRHAPHSRLSPPPVLAPVQTRPSVSLSRTRPRATLSVPTVPTTAAATRGVQDTLRVALASIRPRRTVSLILPSRVRAAAETSISATFARIRPAATAATLAPPTRVRPQEAFLGPATRLAPGRRPAARPLLSPPTIVAGVAPPTPEQLRLLASLTAIQTRLRFRVGRSVFPAVLPPAPPLTLPPFPESTGYAASGADAPGEALPAADSTGQASPGTASQGIAVPVAESTGKAVPGTASDGG